MAEASCPASCGEFIQGWINGGEKLISCPINWFSTVEVTEGTPEPSERPRMRQALKMVLNAVGYADDVSNLLRIRFDSTIPVAKGMASSTADIAATIVATARLLKKRLSEQEIANICLQIEPTDSTIFEALTLFDHNNGKTQIGHNWSPELDILILESDARLITADYHQIDRRQTLLANAEKLEKAWRYFQDAAQTNNLYKLGEATTLSAEASQHILPKPAFHDLMQLVDKHNLYGLNVAHSGTVVGLLFDNRQHDIEKIMSEVKSSYLNRHYPQQHYCLLTAGGIR